MSGSVGKPSQVHPETFTSESMNPGGVSVLASPAASTTPSGSSPSKGTNLNLVPLPKNSRAHGGEGAVVDQQPDTRPRDFPIDSSNEGEGAARGARAAAGDQGKNGEPLKPLKPLPPLLQGNDGNAETSVREQGNQQKPGTNVVDHDGKPKRQEKDGKTEIGDQEQGTKQVSGPNVVDSTQAKLKEKEVNELQKAYGIWLKDCCSKFKEERHDRETIIFGIPWESMESYVMKLAVWMRETGGPMQTEHPIWKSIQGFDKENKETYKDFPEYEKRMRDWVKSIGCPDDVHIDEIESALLDLDVAEKKDDEHSEHDWRSKLPDIKKEHEDDITKLKERYKDVQNRSEKLYRMVKALHSEDILTSLDDKQRKLGDYNICGDLALHMMFLQAYILGGAGGKPNRHILRVGRWLIEEGGFDVNKPYENDLVVWDDILEDADDNFKEGEQEQHSKFVLPEQFSKNVFGNKGRHSPWPQSRVGSPGLYSGETVLHIAIVNGDIRTVEWLLSQGASQLAKADGLFFMPKLTRRGHIQMKQKQTWGWWKKMWNKFKTGNNIQSGDDVVGQQNLLSAYIQPDLYFGQYPLSFAVSQGQKDVLESLKKFQIDRQQTGVSTGKQSKYQEWQKENRSVRWEKVAGCCGLNCSQVFCCCGQNEDEDQVEKPPTGLRKYKELYPHSIEELKKSVEAFRDDVKKKEAKRGGKGSKSISNSVNYVRNDLWEVYGSWEMLANMQDELGNTPLHIAVMHKKTEMCTWLLENEGRKSLRIMNKQGLTPFTLAVWLGDVDMYQHMAENGLSSLLWKYGTDCELKLLDLEQIDTFRMYDPSERRIITRDKKQGGWTISYNDQLHANKKWRSAFEIIVEKELREFTSERIFDHLVMEKWHRFGRIIYFFRVFVLYILVLSLFFAASLTRLEEIKMPEYQDIQSNLTGIAAFQNSSGYMFLALSSGGVVILLNMAWILLRFKRRDLDRDHDGSISTEEAMMFLFKNLGSICNVVSSIIIVLIVISRAYAWGDRWEQDLIACASVVMFSNVLNIVTPFKFIGVLVLTTYRMLISDIARFIIVYIVLLVGFATSMFVLFESAKSGQEGLDFEAMGTSNTLRLADLGSVMRKMLYISLGEVGSLDLEMTLPIQITIYFVWVVLTNVLLLNLLISMMGQTFSDNTQDTHNAWVFPVANFILRCETHILSRRWKQATRCGKRGSVAKVDRAKASANHEDKNEQGYEGSGTTVNSIARTGSEAAAATVKNLLNTVNPGADVNSKEIEEKLQQRTWTDRYMPWGMSTLQLKRFVKERREPRYSPLKPGIPQEAESEDRTIERFDEKLDDLKDTLSRVMKDLEKLTKKKKEDTEGHSTLQPQADSSHDVDKATQASGTSLHSTTVNFMDRE